MSSPTSKPDLDESINVSEAHSPANRETAAAAREKTISDTGSEPITLWLLATCGLVLVIAGGILGSGGNWFSYGTTFMAKYVRDEPEGMGPQGPKPVEALQAYINKGSGVYGKCKSCHGAGAQGGDAYPSLVGSEWVVGDTERLAMIILNGVQGPTSTGKDYGSVMPAMGLQLSGPEDLAAVMTYIRNNFGNSTGDVVTVEMAQKAMEISAERKNMGQAMTAKELANHAKDLPGEPLDPKVLLNPVTLEIVAEEAP